MAVTIGDIELARRRLAGVIKPTSLLESEFLSQLFEADVRLKPEFLQKTGSFKIRGAYNFIVSLNDAEKQRGVVAASAGNHGQALAYAASRASVKATIVMPSTASISKVDATRSYAPSIVLEGIDYQAARAAARRICDESGSIFVDAYDNPLVIAGQGTIGLEIAEELNPDVVLVPTGGGGLLAGIAAALEAHAPDAEVIGVEAAGSPQLSASLKAGSAEAIELAVDTIADGLATGKIGAQPFEIIKRRVRRALTVDDFEIGEAILLMLERMKMLAEGAGAAALAGAIKIKDELRGKRVVVVISGGNIDINLLDRIIGHGLVKVGRLFRFSVDMRDRPGELGKLLSAIAESGANVRAIDHDRTRRDVSIGGARVILELETRGPGHIEAIREYLALNGYVIKVAEM
jgi:threonine dehydratase